MKVTIHQPEFLPYVGLIQKIMASDVFVIYDDVPFTKNNYQNRNRIMQFGTAKFISIPVDHHLDTNIKDTWIKLDGIEKVVDKIKKQIAAEYGKCRYYDEVMKGVLEPLFDTQSFTTISYLNTAIIIRILDYLGINTQIVYSSELSLPGKKTDHLINVCNSLHATEYLSGQGGKGYIEEDKFEKEGIILTYFQPQIKEYPQKNYKEFIPYLSVVDGLFNHGKSFIEYL